MSVFNPELFDAQAFWRNVAQPQNGGCWQWLKHQPFMVQCGIRFPVHHIAYSLTYGRVPAGRTVAHCCHNPLCVNPAHLKLGRRYRIADEFSKLPVSRQRKHQLRKHKAGLCMTGGCTLPPIAQTYCQKHLAEIREYQRKRLGCVKRYNSLSYE